MNTVLPKAVQEQLEAAEKLQAELNQPAPTEVEPPVEEAVVEPQPEPVAEEPVQAQAPTEDAGYWKSRFETMNGKYNAEVPRLHQQMRDMEAKLTQLTEQLSKKPEPQPEQKKSLLTAKDVEDYGEDLIDVIRRAATEQATSLAGETIAKMQERIDQLQAQLGTVNNTVAASLEDKFYATLKGNVPDWEVINKDQGFLNWLSEVDPMSGASRWDYLNDAHKRMDVERVTKIFTAYKDLRAAPARNAANELQRQVAPAKTGSAAPSVDAGKRIWTTAEYANAWDHRLTLKMSDKDIEALRAEADLALAEGRVR